MATTKTTTTTKAKAAPKTTAKKVAPAKAPAETVTAPVEDVPTADERTKAYDAAIKRGAPYMQLSEFADAIGVGRPTLSNWRARYDDFPVPALVCGSVELFSRATMRKYAAGLNYSVESI